LHYDNNAIGTTMGGGNLSIFKIDANGGLVEYIQAENIPPYGTGFGNAIAIDHADNPFISGAFLGTVAFGNDTLTGRGISYDVYVAKLTYTDPVSVTDAAAASALKVFPNPSNGEFQLTGLEAGKDAQIQMLDMLGQQVPFESRRNADNSYLISPAQGLSGMYLMVVWQDGVSSAVRVVLELM
jgi:hypothetical protein